MVTLSRQTPDVESPILSRQRVKRFTTSSAVDVGNLLTVDGGEAPPEHVQRLTPEVLHAEMPTGGPPGYGAPVSEDRRAAP
jgi:hypothetical protein